MCILVQQCHREMAPDSVNVEVSINTLMLCRGLISTVGPMSNSSVA